MTDASDRRLGMDRNISRRDFLDGLAIATGMAFLPFGCTRGGEDTYAPEQAPDYYPPALTGLRGSHPGSYEVAHQLRDGTLEPSLGRTWDTGERYDLVVVGAGISGLAAAYFYCKARPEARVLLLDNHDDLGGHAKRNEFTVGDRLLISYGGTESIESPAQYSTVARGLLADLGIDLQRFYTAFDRGRYQRLGMTRGIFFDRETFGADRMVQGNVSDISRKTLGLAPLTEEIKRDILRLNGNRTNHFPGLSSSEKKARLARMSYRDFLLNVVKVAPGVVPLFQAMTHDLYGVGIDAIPALDCWGLEMPGFEGMKLDPHEPSPGIGRTPLLEMNEEEPYIFHFPDGNASVARLLARRLIPQALPGDSMDDLVTARLAYGRLDQPSNSTRIRLNCTVIRAKHRGDPASARAVEVTYVRGGKARSVRAGVCILACWNMVIPYLCPELSDSQKQALAYGAKVPLVYTNVALNNWRALQKAGVSHVYAPGSYWVNTFLDFPVDLGTYQAPRTPDAPAVVKMVRTPCKPGSPSRVQHRAGREELLQTPFETFERAVRDQLARMFGPAGFDPAGDITAITVNRWPHGYTYEYNSLWDGPWADGEEPCVVGRRQFGRITIANADAGAFAYTNSAIDQAWRAVEELLGGTV
jgi:spermidine dehydrogenase